MKQKSVSIDGTPALIAFSAWLKQVGRSDTTGWRWVRNGWLSPLNIAGRPYLTGEDIHQFVERARKREFSREPKGAAHAAKTRKESAI